MYERVFRNGVFENTILKPEDLARSYVYHTRARLLRSIRMTKDTLIFNENYNPPENISLVAQSANEDWGDTRDQIIEESKQKLKDLRKKMSKITTKYIKIVRGDQNLIDQCSKLEITRRTELKNKEKGKKIANSW